MTSTSLYRKYRPLTFSDVIGQEHIVQTLSNAIKHGRIGHAYLFSGPRGTGKTTLARIFARAVNCSDPKDANSSRQSVATADPCLKCESCQNINEGKSLDIIEIDAASNTGVDNIRELRENIKFLPSQSKYKVYIIDEVHMLSTGAFNALLKTLEEPPAHAIFILATTEIHKVPETIISRCQRYDFTRLPVENIVKKLSLIAKSEKIEIEKEAMEMIAISAEGGMRDAESLLSQVMSLEDKNITAKEVEEILGTAKRQSLEALTGYVLSQKTSEALKLINKLSQDGYDLDVFNKSFLNYLRQAMLVSVDEKLSKIFAYELTEEQAQSLQEQAKNHSPQEFLFIIGCFSEIQGKIKSSFIPQLPLEMAIIKAVNGPENTPEKAPLEPISPKPKQIYASPAQDAPLSSKMAASGPIEPKSIEIPASENAPQIKENETIFENTQFTLDDIKKCWNQTIAEMKPLNHSLSAILQSCRPIQAENGLLSIAARFPFHKDKLNDNANRLTLESVFAKILGFRLRVKAVTSEETFREKETKKDAEKPRGTSSLLTEALNIMGGKVVE